MTSRAVCCRNEISPYPFVVCVFLCFFLWLGTGTAQTFTTIHTFTETDGSGPDAVLVQGRDGQLYGTTAAGGTGTCSPSSGCGTVFKVDSAGNLTTLHNFTGADGLLPQGVVLARDGNFYGTATNGGANGFGVIYRITSSGVFTQLYNFTGGLDGKNPSNQLLQASDGNLYGLTSTGLYRYIIGGGVTTIFTIPTDPIASITAPLIQSADGALYATFPYLYTSFGSSCGSIVKFSLQGAILSEFDFSCNTLIQGQYPYSAVVQATDGSLYGTTNSGGTSGEYYGTAFKLNSSLKAFKVLHNYDFASGRFCFAGLVQGTDGNLYGVTADGGAYPFPGVMYELTPSGIYTSFMTLPDHQEDWPNWSLIQHTDGKFYSTTESGGNATYYGTVYSFDNGLEPFITFVVPQGKSGTYAQILGQGFTGTTRVTFNGTVATSIKILNDTFMMALVPPGATTGPVVVTTPNATLMSNKNFRVTP
jgi:uncharacterized repeat protein (TIGR03803 family)